MNLLYSRQVNRSQSDVGATLVEYALIVALVVVASMSAISAATDNAGEELESRGDTIGHPAEEGATTTSVGGPGTTAPSSSTSAPTYTGSIQRTCSGTGGNTNVCSFALDPPTTLTTTWSISPSTGVSGALPGPVTFVDPGDYTVQATVDGNSIPFALACTKNGSNLKCDKK